MDRNKAKVLQDAQLDILMYVHDICDRLKISYFLIYGSLLGAIRHSGPIPWDVDIDIAMFRDDYEKLKQYFCVNDDQRYFYSDYSTYKHHIAPHAVLIDKTTHISYFPQKQSKYSPAYDGIYIDIFPIDRTASDRDLQRKQAKSLLFLKKIISYKQAPVYAGITNSVQKAVKKIISVLLAPFTLRFLGRRISKVQQKYEHGDADCYVIPTDGQSFDRIIPIDYYFPARVVPYGDKQVYIPAKAEELLKMIYNNYMELPPEEKRWDYLDNIINDVKFDL